MSRRPDFEVKVGRKVERGEKSYAKRVGAAFTNSAGGINILLDPGIALVGGEGVQITLWPWPDDDGRARQSGGSPMRAQQDDRGFDDDVPF